MPDAKISWIIGNNEYELVKDIGNINWVVIDKSRLFAEWLRLKKIFKNTNTDILLHMQASLRASILSTAIKAKKVIGFDKERSKDYQHLFCNEKILRRKDAHVLETFLDFVRTLELDTSKIEWNLPLANMQNEAESILNNLPDRFALISPCSSKKIRNWTLEGYAKIADYIYEKYKLPTVLTGGPSEFEKEFAGLIVNKSKHKPINLTGQTSIRQMLAVLERAEFIIAPDSGPGHLGSAVKTPVIGLFANTNPKRARSYQYPEYVVDKYPAAVKKYLGKDVAELKFGTRVRDPKVMHIIKLADVRPIVDKLIKHG